jgi:hypothetical protein
MWLIAVIPAIAAAVIGVVTGLSPEIARWKRITVIVLTALTIAAVVGNQWWEHRERVAEEAKRTAVLETLGSLIDDGQNLTNEILSNVDQPVPEQKINEWANKTEAFLQTLGNSYVVRFRSDAGIMSVTFSKADTVHNNWLVGIRSRLIRLHEFSSEFSGQTPKASSDSPF